MHVADSHDLIRVAGARENNLKNISVEIPKRRLTVFTGVSGSGSPPAVSIWPMSTTFSVFSTGWSSQGSTLTGQHLAGYVGAK